MWLDDEYRAVRLDVADGRLPYWTVLDSTFRRVPVVDDFLFSLVRSGRALNTSRAYAYDAAGYLRWASTRGLPWMDPRSLDDYQAHLLTAPGHNDRPRAPTTVNRQLTSTRALLRYCVETERLPASSMGALYSKVDFSVISDETVPYGAPGSRSVARHRLRSPINDPLPPDLHRTEYVAMLEAARSNRDRLLLSVMHDCGLRIGEAIGLWRSDMHLSMERSRGCSVEGPHLHVRRRLNTNGATAKSKTARWVPVTPEVIGWYSLYLRERDAVRGAGSEPLLFVNLGREAGRGITYSNAYQLVRSIGRRAALTRPVNPHMLRHSYGTGLRRGGASREVIATLMGHASMSSADVYIHPSTEELHAAVAHMLALRAEGAK